jgi:hypothetical protein
MLLILLLLEIVLNGSTALGTFCFRRYSFVGHAGMQGMDGRRFMIAKRIGCILACVMRYRKAVKR